MSNLSPTEISFISPAIQPPHLLSSLSPVQDESLYPTSVLLDSKIQLKIQKKKNCYEKLAKILRQAKQNKQNNQATQRQQKQQRIGNLFQRAMKEIHYTPSTG